MPDIPPSELKESTNVWITCKAVDAYFPSSTESEDLGIQDEKLNSYSSLHSVQTEPDSVEDS